MKKFTLNRKLFRFNMQLFDSNPNTTGSAGMSKEMKTFYDKNLLKETMPELVHDQFGQERDIPKNGGKTIEFRKYSALPKATTPLTEGVTPTGQDMTVTAIESTIKQYGAYVTLSDLLIETAIDKNIVEATELIGSQAGRTLDTITREILNAGTNVMYQEGTVSSRVALTSAMKLTVKTIKMAVRALKKQNTAKHDGYYWAIIHPDCAFDITEDEKFVEVVKYKNPERIYNGEIGVIEGVRFIETTEAKIFVGAGASGIDVYSTLIGGKNAYGVTKVEGEGLKTIIKNRGSAGTADPLDQRSTVGWKATKTATILNNMYMIRVETASTFNDGVAN